MGAEQRYDAAILFVHGIGEQTRAAVLTDYVRPLMAWLDPWCRALGGRGAVISQTDANEDLGLRPYRVIEAGTGTGEGHRWYLSEARWASSFQPPGIVAVLTWGMRFCWLVALRAGRYLAQSLHNLSAVSLRAAVQASQVIKDAASGLAIVFLGPMLVVLFAAVVTGFGLALALISSAYISLIVMLLVGSLVVSLSACAAVVLRRVPLIKAKIEGRLARAAAVVGDAHAWRDLPDASAAMRHVVRREIEALTEIADKVLVVAHSQGAAIALDVLLGSERKLDNTILITLGSGVSLLGPDAAPVSAWSAQHPELRWINVWATWDLVSAGPVGDTSRDRVNRWKASFELSGTTPGAGATVAPVPPPHARRPADPASIGLLLLPEVAKDEPVGTSASPAADPPPGARAVTTTSSPSDYPPGPEEWPVHNASSPIRDHGGYKSNLIQVIGPIAILLTGLSGSSAEARACDSAMAAASAFRVVRVRLFAAARILCGIVAAATVSLLVFYGVADDTIKAASTGIGLVSESAQKWAVRLGGSAPGRVVLLSLLGLAAFRILSGATTIAWGYWDRAAVSAVHQAATGRGGQAHLHSGAAPFLAVFVALLAAPTAIGALLVEASIHAASWGPWDYVVLVAVTAFLFAFWPVAGPRPRQLAPRLSTRLVSANEPGGGADRNAHQSGR